MVFYDLHTHTNLSIGENRLEDMIEFAKRLGLGGMGVVQYYPEVTELPTVNGIDLVNCVMVKAKNASDLLSTAQKVRDKCEILMVHGGDYDVNRAACENSLVDVLCHPELGRKDSGFDHVCAKAAADNNVAVEINFREILESSKRNRTYVLSAIKKNVKLAQKYGAPLLVTSGAVTKWDIRSGRELAAVANLLGLELGQAIDSASVVPEKIAKTNREKLAGRSWQGVRVVE